MFHYGWDQRQTTGPTTRPAFHQPPTSQLPCLRQAPETSCLGPQKSLVHTQLDTFLVVPFLRTLPAEFHYSAHLIYNVIQDTPFWKTLLQPNLNSFLEKPLPTLPPVFRVARPVGQACWVLVDRPLCLLAGEHRPSAGRERPESAAGRTASGLAAVQASGRWLLADLGDLNLL